MGLTKVKEFLYFSARFLVKSVSFISPYFTLDLISHTTFPIAKQSLSQHERWDVIASCSPSLDKSGFVNYV